LRRRGVGRKDRVAILLPQGAAVPIAHVAIYKLGAIALPLAALFGVDAIAYRLGDAGAKTLITNAAGLAKLRAIESELPLDTILSLDGSDAGADDFWTALSRESADFQPVLTAADDPAMMIYTSGTTGQAKGAGRPVPGHIVTIIREDGTVCAPGELGQIAVARPDPAMFLSYWNNPAATAAKFVGDFMTTGDQGICDEDGYVRFVGRDDDVITSSGYRIGPGEIEDCLIRHPAVALAAVVGKPDPVRTEIVKAYVVLKDGAAPSETLAREIQAFVRERLSAHEYPREVAFRASLPMTTTGKIIRRLLRDEAV
jgi:acyl-coenzyme A synthetase/AMP-(fatty) acid ligase